MTEEDLKIINDEIKEMYLIVQELLKIENYERVDYSGVLSELSWNRYMLKNRLSGLKEEGE